MNKISGGGNRSRNTSPNKGKLSRQVGSKTKCTMVDGSTIEGTVYLHDANARILVLYTAKDNETFSELRLINTAHIDDGKKKGTPLRTKETKISDECRVVLEALSRHFKCRAQNNTIIVSEEFRIEPPYTQETTYSISAPDAAGLQRLRKVLESERSVIKKTQPVQRRKRDDKLPVKGG